jgi:hypothetical protein
MALHRLSPAAGTVHGIFSRELAPVLTISSGDSVVFQTLDAGWGALEQAPGFTVPQAFAPRDLARDVAHCLTGPVRVEGAKPGMVLEIRIHRLRTGRWGWSAGPTLPAQMDKALGLSETAGGPPQRQGGDRPAAQRGAAGARDDRRQGPAPRRQDHRGSAVTL